ncbi:anti-sigma factor [Arthrobacter pascens]|uniref:anti-sigma factor n=1 Tax=Arthrobacter pascens TaxID=1677 RepID=UPI00196AC9E1|nr:anti-sigma factor [Arthrobacter pascens]MBN3496458.1 anti-sigma factor [Arthrobacter pascens]
MQHPDPEILSLLALNEPLGDEQTMEHLRSCPECAAEYAALRRAVSAVRTTPDSSVLEPPGANVWTAIHRELGLSEAVARDPLTSAPAVTGTAEPAETAKPAAPVPSRTRSSNVTWLRRPMVWLAAAAALVVAAGIALSVGRPAPPLAEAELAPLAQYSATGSAKVTESRDGSRTIEVELNKTEAKGYQEVWLIAPDLSRLVSLGIMNSSSGRFEVPAGLDLSAYPIVDVSDEPLDGDPAHSSVSIVRGTLKL